MHLFSIRANEIIDSFDGRIAEFRGDSVLAIWNGTNEESAQNALDAAVALNLALGDGLLADHHPAGLEPMALGIGLDQVPYSLDQSDHLIVEALPFLVMQ